MALITEGQVILDLAATDRHEATRQLAERLRVVLLGALDLPGRRLDELVAETGPLQGEALRQLARGVADALTTLHGAGVVHRDLTPGNVLVLDGSPQVIDLGLATAADVTALTRTGLVVGTPGYLAPEQVTGHEVTTAADVHAWGATVALAGTGRAKADSLFAAVELALALA